MRAKAQLKNKQTNNSLGPRHFHLCVKWTNFIHFKVLSGRIWLSERKTSADGPDGLATTLH